MKIIGNIFSAVGSAMLMAGLIVGAFFYMNMFGAGMASVGAGPYSAFYLLFCFAFCCLMLGVSARVRKAWRMCLGFVVVAFAMIAVGVTGLLEPAGSSLQQQEKMLREAMQLIALGVLYGVPGVVAIVYASIYYYGTKQDKNTAALEGQ